MSGLCFRIVLVLTVVSVVLFAIPSAFGQTFVQHTYSSPNGPTDLFVADLNRDGKPDVVTTQSLSNAVTVFLNHGDGTFTSGGSAAYLTARSPQRVVVADFNGDGKLDIATANCDPATHTGSVSVLFGNGDGTFQNHQDYPLATPACPNSLGFLRVASDRLPSLVVANDGTNDIVVFRNQGAGTFTPQRFTNTGGATVRGVSTADYNRDGLQDIAAVISNPGQEDAIVIYHGTSTGTFSGANVVNTFVGHFIATNTVDISGDGIADLFIPDIGAHPDGEVLVELDANGRDVNSRGLGYGVPFTNVGWKSTEGDVGNNGGHSIFMPGFGDPKGGPDGFTLVPASAVGGKLPNGIQTVYTTGTNSQPQAAASAFFNNDNLRDFAGVTFGDNMLRIFLNNTGAPGTSEPCSSDAGVYICSPANRSTLGTTFHLSAGITWVGKSQFTTAIDVFLDTQNILHRNTNDSGIQTDLTVNNPGTHTLTVQSTDNFGNKSRMSITITLSGSGNGCGKPSVPGVAVCSPLQGSTVGSPVRISASANGGSRPITAMKAYMDGKQVLASGSGALSGSVAEAAGGHTLTVNAWDSSGKLYQKIVTFKVQ